MQHLIVQFLKADPTLIEFYPGAKADDKEGPPSAPGSSTQGQPPPQPPPPVRISSNRATVRSLAQFGIALSDCDFRRYEKGAREGAACQLSVRPQLLWQARAPCLFNPRAVRSGQTPPSPPRRRQPIWCGRGRKTRSQWMSLPRSHSIRHLDVLR